MLYSLKIFAIFVSTLILLSIGFTGICVAQDESEISTVYLDDMKDFYRECDETPALKNSYDCRCLSIQYLDKIQILGSYDRGEVVENLDKNACPRTKDTIAREKMAGLPPAYLEEAQEFFDSCGGHLVYGSHYNCECLSSKYLDQRIKLGRFADPSLIKLNISNSCASEPAAAGYAYKNCMKRGFNVPTRFGIKEYCSCIANEYAEMYVRSGQSFSPKLLIALQTEANLRCQKKL